MKDVAYYQTDRYSNFYQLLLGIHEKNAGQIAVRYARGMEEVQIRYDEMLLHISSLYRYFQKEGIRDRHIGILSENRYEYIPIYLASVFDNVIVPIDKELTEKMAAAVIRQLDVTVLFYTEKTKALALSAIRGSQIRGICIDETLWQILETPYPLESFFRDVCHVEDDRFSVLVATSGTTGEVKGVMLSQRNVVSNLRAGLENNRFSDPALLILPMNHTYGFGPGVLTTFHNGGTLCINMDLRRFAADLKRYDPYYLGAVPMVVEGMYEELLRQARRMKKEKKLKTMIGLSNALRKVGIDLRHRFFGKLFAPRLRMIVCGGAALDPWYIHRFDELGITVLNGYGLTECAPLVAVERSVCRKPGSVGTVIRDVDVKIAPDGEVLVKGPNVMLGYYKDPASTAACMEDGHFKTGDLGRLEGRILYITGRKKNIIVLKNGKNVSPEPIEERLRGIPYVKECIVTGQARGGDIILLAKLYCEDPPDGKRLREDLRKACQTLPSYMQIGDYVLMEQCFEKNSTQKIVRKEYVGTV